MTKIIAIDVDGVCADLHTSWINRYNRDWDDNLQVSDITDWYIHQFCKPECGNRMYEYIEDPTIYDETFPITGSQITLELLRESRPDFRFIYVTSSTRGTMGRKYDWLVEHGFIKDLDDYVEMKDKSLVRADGLLDDYQGNIIKFHGEKFLFDSPWNKNFHHSSVIRIFNWMDASVMIKRAFPKGEF